MTSHRSYCPGRLLPSCGIRIAGRDPHPRRGRPGEAPHCRRDPGATDGYIGTLRTRYHYRFWEAVTAIVWLLGRQSARPSPTRSGRRCRISAIPDYDWGSRRRRRSGRRGPDPVHQGGFVVTPPSRGDAGGYVMLDAAPFTSFSRPWRCTFCTTWRASISRRRGDVPSWRSGSVCWDGEPGDASSVGRVVPIRSSLEAGFAEALRRSSEFRSSTGTSGGRRAASRFLLEHRWRVRRGADIDGRRSWKPRPPKSAADLEWICRRFLRSSALAGPFASSVKTPSSTALNSVFEAQKPRPTCMMCSGVTGSALSISDLL